MCELSGCQAEQAGAPGGGVAGGRDVAERHVPAGPGARAHGRHVARAVLLAARRLRARRRRRGVPHALQVRGLVCGQRVKSKVKRALFDLSYNNNLSTDINIAQVF